VKRWPKRQEDWLRKNYSTLGVNESARVLGKSAIAIRHKASKLELPMDPAKRAERIAESKRGRKRPDVSEKNRTHGASNTAEYKIWSGMKKRCYNPNSKAYRFYGERGVQVCDRWLNSFENFLADMGRRPSKRHTIDRRDNSKGYEPGNCRWATWTEQHKNQRYENNGKNNRVLTESQVAEIKSIINTTVFFHGGRYSGVLTLEQISARYNVSSGTISAIKSGRTWRYINS
jgi:hypothetical protein